MNKAMTAVKVATLLAGTGIVCSGGAWAETDIAEDDKSWYVEAGYHHGRLETPDGSETITVGLVGANAGYKFDSGWGIEATVAQGVMEDDVTILSLDVPFKAGTWYGFAVKYTQDVGEKGTAFLKLRGTSVEIEAEGPGFTVSESEFKGGWSIGGTYAMSENAYGILELNQFMDSHLGLFVGVGLSF